MKLLLIARPSAYRNEVSAFLERRGAEVEVRGLADPSALRAMGGVDAVLMLEDGAGDGGRSGDGTGRWEPGVPVIRWPRLRSQDLRELAFRVAQVAHGTAAGRGARRAGPRSRRARAAGSAAGVDAA